jgi:REP element-mobilizing transposase RayT
MSRPLRLEYQGALFHITSRGNERRNIFLDDADRERFLSFMGKAVARFHWMVMAYVLMSNHFHLVVKLSTANLSRGMHWLNGKYSQAFNRRHDRVGHLLQGRFGGELVDEEAYLLEVLRYVVLNPVRAGMVRAPGDYQWSSYRAMAGQATAPDWLAVDNVLAQFGSQRSIAQARYERFVSDAIGSERVPWDDLIGGIYLGNEEWVAGVRARVESAIRPDEHPRPQRHIRRSMAHVITSVATAMQIDERWLRLGRGGRERMLAAWLAINECGLTLSATAAGLRLRSSSHVSAIVRGCDEQLESDLELRTALERCSQTLHQLWKSDEPQV